MRDFMSRLHLV